MQKVLFYLTMLVLISIVTMATVSFFNVASAEGLTNLRDEFSYGYQANLERQQEQNQELARQQYEQRQYLQQQEAVNQLDMYNQTHHYPGREATYRFDRR
jgi:hypothetical protein